MIPPTKSMSSKIAEVAASCHRLVALILYYGFAQYLPTSLCRDGQSLTGFDESYLRVLLTPAARSHH